MKIDQNLQQDIVVLEKVIGYCQKDGILSHQQGAYKGKLNKAALKQKKDAEFKEKYPQIVADMAEVYNRFSSDIEDLYQKYLYKSEYSNPEQDGTLQFKVAIAIEHLMFVKDKRSLTELVESVYSGWQNEMRLMQAVTKAGLHIKLDGADKERKISFFNFNSNPDFIINGHKVEYQQGFNPFFKKNKLEKNVLLDSFILFKEPELGYHLFTTQEIKHLLLNTGNAIRYGKSGRLFKKEDYDWYPNIGDALSELGDGF